MRVPAALLRAVVRARGGLPRDRWPALLQLASLLPGELPVAGPPTARRVVVVAPHPDDETIGCGGTLALLADAGADVQVVVVTDGEATIGSPHAPEETAARRRREAAAACTVLGVAPPTFLGLPDGRLPEVPAAVAHGVGGVIDVVDPDLVLAPWPLDRHPDHRLCAAVVGDLVDEGVAIWGYEAHVPLTPTRAVDVTGVVERKRAALQAHATAALAMDLEATLGLNRWRSIPTTGGTGWVEAFLALERDAWRRAVVLEGTISDGPGARPPPR